MQVLYTSNVSQCISVLILYCKIVNADFLHIIIHKHRAINVHIYFEFELKTKLKLASRTNYNNLVALRTYHKAII